MHQVDRIVRLGSLSLVLRGVEVRDDLVAGLGQADGFVGEGDGLDLLSPGHSALTRCLHSRVRRAAGHLTRRGARVRSRAACVLPVLTPAGGHPDGAGSGGDSTEDLHDGAHTRFRSLAGAMTESSVLDAARPSRVGPLSRDRQDGQTRAADSQNSSICRADCRASAQRPLLSRTCSTAGAA